MPRKIAVLPNARLQTAPIYERIRFSEDQQLELLPFRPGQVDGVLWREIQPHHDERGWLCELFRHDELRSELQPAMGYLSMTLPGATRGPHEHLQQSDIFAFFGPTTFHLYLWDHRTESPTYLCHEIAIIGGARPMSVIVPPGVVHAYRNIGNTPGMVINCPNRLYRGDGRRDPADEIRHEDDPQSVFRFLA